MNLTVLKDYIYYFKDLVSGARTRGELGCAQLRVESLDPYLCLDKAPLNILDLANGELRPQSYILKNMGHNVIGVDYVNRFTFSFKRLLYIFARILFILHLPRTDKATGSTKFIFGDVARLPIESESVDLVTSVAAFEHFLDVPSVVKECYRILRPGGVAWIAIHMFPALSGGHNVGMRLAGVSEMPEGVEPWDHLREQKLPFSVPLNKWRKSQYVEEFGKHFVIERAECLGREGEELITPEILDELSAYDSEDLTCSSFLILARKK